MSTTRKILLFILSSPFIVVCLALNIISLLILPFILPFILLIYLMELVKKTGDEKYLISFLRSFCFMGAYVYFDIIWNYEIFDF